VIKVWHAPHGINALPVEKSILRVAQVIYAMKIWSAMLRKLVNSADRMAIPAAKVMFVVLLTYAQLACVFPAVRKENHAVRVLNIQGASLEHALLTIPVKLKYALRPEIAIPAVKRISLAAKGTLVTTCCFVVKRVPVRVAVILETRYAQEELVVVGGKTKMVFASIPLNSIHQPILPSVKQETSAMTSAPAEIGVTGTPHSTNRIPLLAL